MICLGLAELSRIRGGKICCFHTSSSKCRITPRGCDFFSLSLAYWCLGLPPILYCYCAKASCLLLSFSFCLARSSGVLFDSVRYPCRAFVKHLISSFFFVWYELHSDDMTQKFLLLLSFQCETTPPLVSQRINPGLS